VKSFLRAFKIDVFVHPFEDGLFVGRNRRKIIQRFADVKILTLQAGFGWGRGRCMKQGRNGNDFLGRIRRAPREFAAGIHVVFKKLDLEVMIAGF